MNVETIARAALADFLGGSPDEVAFGANRTTLTFHLGRALGRHWSADGELVVAELHHAHADPSRLARERGLVVRTVRFPRRASSTWTTSRRRSGR